MKLITRGEINRWSVNKLKEKVQELKRAKQISANARPEAERWSIQQADINEYQPDKQYDFIITIVYPREYLGLDGILAEKRSNG